MKIVDVRGYCPMGCGQTLQVEAGFIICVAPGCPDEAATTKIISEQETEHVVTFYPSNYSMQHPLRERIDGQLLDCDSDKYISEHGRNLGILGKYRMRKGVAGWVFDSLH